MFRINKHRYTTLSYLFDMDSIKSVHYTKKNEDIRRIFFYNIFYSFHNITLSLAHVSAFDFVDRLTKEKEDTRQK
jgi:hypothetical protein